MEKDSTTLFFQRNEDHINKIIGKVLMLSLLVFPVLICGKYFGIFPQMDYKRILLFMFFVMIINFVRWVLCRFPSASKFVKYYCLIMIELLILLITIERGFSSFISYVLVILISCLYFDNKFSLFLLIFSYIGMFVSLVIRARTQIPTYYEGMTSKEWFDFYFVSTFLEYTLYSFIAYILTKISRDVLVQTYLRRTKLGNMQEQLIHGFANLVESKDLDTGQHIKRTSGYVELICEQLIDNGIYKGELDEYSMRAMVRAAPFHDIGKIKIPDKILNKKGPLSASEFSIIKEHPIIGAELISKNMVSIEDSELIKYSHDMALYHHERFDGTGYPYGYAGLDIPLCARIMAAADILDALLSIRSYKKALNIDEALLIISKSSGTALDNNIAEILCNSREKILLIQKSGI